MAKVLITGGAGFIGSHTARKLLDGGEEVFVYDFFHHYVIPIQSTFMENMLYRSSCLLKGAQVVRGSTHNKDQLRRHLVSIKPEYVIHLAALPLANVAIRATEEAFESIVQGTVNILEVLRDMNSVEKFVYISSSMVYGDFKQVPMPENGQKEPKEIYGSMKLAGEILLKAYSQRYGIPYVIVRPSAVYGPTDNNRRVLQIFVENAFQGKQLNLHNPDSTVLDFTFVEDVADGLRLLTLSSDAINQEFNLTFGQGHSLHEVVDILRRFFPNVEVRKLQDVEESFRPRRGTLDISKAKALVGFEPKYPIELGLEKYVNFIATHNPSISAGCEWQPS